MTQRQQVLLAILQQAGGQATRLHLVKWAFLLSQETPSQGGENFYQFLPYRYGAYSFTLNHEMDGLVGRGLVNAKDKKVWELTPRGKSQTPRVTKAIKQDIAAIIQQYGQLSGSGLLALVNRKYPWFSVNNELSENRAQFRPVADLAIYTIGCGTHTVDGFLNELMQAGVGGLIDIRLIEKSPPFGFDKKQLSLLCRSLDLSYNYVPQLSLPALSLKDGAVTGDGPAQLEAYFNSLEPQRKPIEKVISLLQSGPRALVGTVANPEFCHRNGLAHYLFSQMELPIRHIGYGGPPSATVIDARVEYSSDLFK